MINNQVRLSIINCLDKIISRSDCVLSYDCDLVSLLPDILVENYGIISNPDIVKLKPLQEFCELLASVGSRPAQLVDLPAVLRSSGLSLEKYSSRAPEDKTSKLAKEFEHWSEQSADASLNSVIALQKDLGMGAHQQDSGRYDAHLKLEHLRHYLRNVSTPPPTLVERLLRRSFWELEFALWLASGKLKKDRPSLSVGPRWVTEIEFFRKVVGLRGHIGLDLFSDDSGLVVKGDMHQMPFDDGHFQLVFLKNVVDKSYDVRKLVRELIRVVEPGGIVVVDQVCGYGSTTPLTRTDIQKAANLARIFERYCPVKRMVCRDIDISGLGDARAAGEKRNNARLAISLK